MARYQVSCFQQKIEDEDEEHFEAKAESGKRKAKRGTRNAEWVSAGRRNEHAGRGRSPKAARKDARPTGNEFCIHAAIIGQCGDLPRGAEKLILNRKIMRKPQ